MYLCDPSASLSVVVLCLVVVTLLSFVVILQPPCGGFVSPCVQCMSLCSLVVSLREAGGGALGRQ